MKWFVQAERLPSGHTHPPRPVIIEAETAEEALRKEVNGRDNGARDKLNWFKDGPVTFWVTHIDHLWPNEFAHQDAKFPRPWKVFKVNYAPPEPTAPVLTIERQEQS